MHGSVWPMPSRTRKTGLGLIWSINCEKEIGHPGAKTDQNYPECVRAMIAKTRWS